MDAKLNFSSEELLNKQFSKANRGYEPLEVDMVLDKIINDYETFEKVLSSSSGMDLEKMVKELKVLKEENETLKKDLEKEKDKWKYVSRDHKDIHIDNYELLNRIGKLEMLIYEKLHISPDDIK